MLKIHAANRTSRWWSVKVKSLFLWCSGRFKFRCACRMSLAVLAIWFVSRVMRCAAAPRSMVRVPARREAGAAGIRLTADMHSTSTGVARVLHCAQEEPQSKSVRSGRVIAREHVRSCLTLMHREHTLAGRLPPRVGRMPFSTGLPISQHESRAGGRSLGTRVAGVRSRSAPAFGHTRRAAGWSGECGPG